MPIPADHLIAPPVRIPKAKAALPLPRAIAVAEAVVERAQLATLSRWSRWLRWLGGRHALASSFTVSAVVHAVLLVMLGLWMIAAVGRGRGNSDLFAAMTTRDGGPRLVETVSQTHAQPDAEAPPPVSAEARITTRIDVRPLSLNPAAPPSLALTSEVGSGFNGAALLSKTGGLSGGGLGGRTATGKAGLVDRDGGNKFSEEAANKGLRWLQAHQRPNGSWCFDHSDGTICKGLCANTGSESSTTAATAMALLAFLGGGYTHREGPFQETVASGLNYLSGRMLYTPYGGDFQEGTMYAQGLTAIALCEAAAMTKDRSLEAKAQYAIDFIVYAQDKKGGGWRYTPGQPGDTTVTGWMFMALRSAQMSGLRVPREAVNGAIHFLDHVESEYGAFYGYQDSGKQPVSTAVGLLSRMYTGWKRSHPPLINGVRYLSKLGPSKTDMYFNYYATQVLHHWGDDEWKRWNETMRDSLIASQATQGHESGSWFFRDDHNAAAKGGRLYNTCLAIMTLEVYYRYMPLYEERSVDGE